MKLDAALGEAPVDELVLELPSVEGGGGGGGGVLAPVSDERSCVTANADCCALCASPDCTFWINDVRSVKN